MKEILTWQDIETLSDQLVASIDAGGETFTDILALARGGMFPATLLAYGLGVRSIHSIALASYEQDSQGALEVKSDLPNLEGRSLLIVDDLADTGKTLDFVKRLYPKAKVACLLTKPEGKSRVDFFVKEYAQSVWIDFPWEKNEAEGIEKSRPRITQTA